MGDQRSWQRLATIGHHLHGSSGTPRHIAEFSVEEKSQLCINPTSTSWELDAERAKVGLDMAIAFPQATSASKFPPCVSDYYQLDDLLTPEEKAVRARVRETAEKHIAPIISKYWEKAEFPFELVPKFAQLKVSGGTIQGYGCPGLSLVGVAIAMAEIARVDASCSSFMLVHTCVAMLTIAMCGSEEQKQRYLPSLASLDKISCWALTEPDYGSDASSLATTATKVEGGYLLNGQKRWNANCTFADVHVVFARNTQTNQINGFIVKKGTPGFTATKIENKIAVRVIQNGDIVLKEVFVPDEDHLVGVKSFEDTAKVLAVARVVVAWQTIGISMGVYDMCQRYLQERKQFGVPLASYQINQEKLTRMLGNIQAMSLMGWRLCKLYEAGKMTHGHASLAKAFCDLEPIYTYEGTYDMNSLIVGREVTGIASFKAPFKGERVKQNGYL